MECGGYRADAFRQALDEIRGAVRIVADQAGDMVAFGRVLDPIPMDQRHWVRLDGLDNDELHPRQTDTIDRKPRVPKGLIRVAEIDHDACLWARQQAEIDAINPERHGAVIDHARVALGAGHGHYLSFRQR